MSVADVANCGRDYIDKRGSLFARREFEAQRFLNLVGDDECRRRCDVSADDRSGDVLDQRGYAEVSPDDEDNADQY